MGLKQGGNHRYATDERSPGPVSVWISAHTELGGPGPSWAVPPNEPENKHRSDRLPGFRSVQSERAARRADTIGAAGRLCFAARLSRPLRLAHADEAALVLARQGPQKGAHVGTFIKES